MSFCSETLVKAVPIEVMKSVVPGVGCSPSTRHRKHISSAVLVPAEMRSVKGADKSKHSTLLAFIGDLTFVDSRSAASRDGDGDFATDIYLVSSLNEAGSKKNIAWLLLELYALPVSLYLTRADAKPGDFPFLRLFFVGWQALQSCPLIWSNFFLTSEVSNFPLGFCFSEANDAKGLPFLPLFFEVMDFTVFLLSVSIFLVRNDLCVSFPDGFVSLLNFISDGLVSGQHVTLVPQCTIECFADNTAAQLDVAKV